MPVSVRVEGGPAVDSDAVEADAARLLEALGMDARELSLVLADDAFVRPLNATWRGVDAATDVLSFPQEEPVSAWGLLGDVVISTETAARQAVELGHALDVEVRVLLVHGLLHLLGHDHEKGAARARSMRSEEVRLLALLGIHEDVALIERAR